MKKSKVVILVMFFLCISCKTSDNKTQSASTIQEEYDNLFNTGNNNFIISSSDDIFNEKSLSVDLDLDCKKETIIIRSDYSGVKVLGFKGKYGANLLSDKKIYYDERTRELLNWGFNESGELEKGYYIQVSYVDLNNDHKYEVLISIGNKESEMITAIYKVRDADEDSFKLMGIIVGQAKMYLEGNHIIAPYGSQGLYEEYIYDGDRIFQAMI